MEKFETQVNNRELLKEMLHRNVMSIHFKKKDGTLRKMKATLNPSYIPSKPVVESETPKRTRAENPDVQPVYDMESQGWRSFRWDSLVAFGVNMNEG